MKPILKWVVRTAIFNIGNNSKPRVINIDKSGANKSGIRSINRELMTEKKTKIRQCKYLNNIVEQDGSVALTKKSLFEA